MLRRVKLPLKRCSQDRLAPQAITTSSGRASECRDYPLGRHRLKRTLFRHTDRALRFDANNFSETCTRCTRKNTFGSPLATVDSEKYACARARIIPVTTDINLKISYYDISTVNRPLFILRRKRVCVLYGFGRLRVWRRRGNTS